MDSFGVFFYETKKSPNKNGRLKTFHTIEDHKLLTLNSFQMINNCIPNSTIYEKKPNFIRKKERQTNHKYKK